MDEATSSIDFETDHIIQTTISNQFREKTLLIVAHRLNTIINCDLILMLDQGKVLELGSPAELLQKNGHFAHLVNETGEESANHLRSIALGSTASIVQ